MSPRLALALALPLLAASPSAPDEVRFGPREGLRLTRTFVTVSETSTESASDRGSSTTSEQTSERTLVVTDSIEAMDGDRITRLVRTYDEIAAETETSLQYDGGSNDSSSEGSSDAEGGTVVFEWDEDDEEYVASSDDIDDVDELPWDLDFLALLPDGEVDEDDDWSIEAETFQTLMDPWKGLPLDLVTSDGQSYSTSDDDEEGPEIDESIDGDVTITYAGTRDVDGVTMAVLSLEGEIEIERTTETSSDYDGGSSTYRQELTETREIEGEVLWHLAGGHLHSLEIEMSIDATGVVESTFTFGDREFENNSEEDMSGTLTYSVTFELAEEG